MRIVILITFLFVLSHTPLNIAMDTQESSTDELSCSSEGSCLASPRIVVSQANQELHKQLRQAIKRGEIKPISLFLEQGGNVEGIRKSKKQTLLMYASQYGQVEICKFLINAKANVNADDYGGSTPLLFASNEHISKILLEARADVNAKDISGETALFHCKSNEQCRLLLQAGADVNVRNIWCDTALFQCAFLQVTDADLITRKKKILEQFRLLLEAGADINTKNEAGETILHQYFDHSDIIQLSLEHYADVNSQDNNGTTVLMIASRFSETFDIAKELIAKHHADMHIQDTHGNTALIRAATFKQINTCKFLVEHQKQLDLGMIVALGCIKRKCKESLAARSLYHDRNGLLVPYIRSYTRTHSLKSLLNAQIRKGKTAYDILNRKYDFLKPIRPQSSSNDNSPDMSPLMHFFYDDLSSASPQNMIDDQESLSGEEEGSSGSENNSGYKGE